VELGFEVATAMAAKCIAALGKARDHHHAGKQD
jgi:hypothetical protein